MTHEPNFSIVLPGGCNMNCNFCSWERSENESGDFLADLRLTLDDLGDKVTQISITGGEPTISPMFTGLINMLRDYSDKKIVLTTNGSNLLPFIDNISGIVNHINVSRHNPNPQEPWIDNRHLRYICYGANTYMIDVTLNCVINSATREGYIRDMIDAAKHVGASSVCFRKDYKDGTLDKTPAEIKIADDRTYTVDSCPVCVSNCYLIDGMFVYFKASISEPGNHVDYNYEYIFHPDGKLYHDWAAKKPI